MFLGHFVIPVQKTDPLLSGMQRLMEFFHTVREIVYLLLGNFPIHELLTPSFCELGLGTLSHAPFLYVQVLRSI